ncbi:YbaK/EbsC family protein [Microvirga terricola]|uniref:YbaK/EbsC family protein n=1 Tax=Microvirga terricola TaxID=2719797 RepID=A0ABX0V8Q3_9HYPH|nr:YbaK/EbsC family protein [Microvirga terricola]NIX76223.1 YbaK/EbsC family protein [Microvirga terricola]
MNVQLPPSTQRVQRAAAELRLDVLIREMPQSTRTAEEAAAACECAVGQIVKSLVFQGATSGTPYLLLVSGKNRVDQEGVTRTIGEALTRPDAAQVRAWTGYAIGGIPPFGHDTPMRTFIDRDLLDHPVVWAAAGTPQTVFSVEPKALAQAVDATVIAVTGE